MNLRVFWASKLTIPNRAIPLNSTIDTYWVCEYQAKWINLAASKYFFIEGLACNLVTVKEIQLNGLLDLVNDGNAQGCSWVESSWQNQLMPIFPRKPTKLNTT